MIGRLILICLCFITLFSRPAYAQRAKVLFVNSYHQGYRWSDDIEKGLFRALGLAVSQADLATNDTLRLRVIRMDTKRHPDEAFKRAAALRAKAAIDRWRPDVVVVSDDNAARHLIVPYFKDAQTPFVFCGLNWDASVYGFPFSNVTGMVEVSPIAETIEMLRPYARGARLGYIGFASPTNRKETAFHENHLGIGYTDGELCEDFGQWKAAYLRLQASVDILLWQNCTNIRGWQAAEAEAFVHEHTRIPTGALGDPMIRFALLGRVKIAAEQGWWAGRTALRILAGTPPSEIPITHNRQSRLYLNMRLAKRLGIRFPMTLLQRATLLEEVSLP